MIDRYISTNLKISFNNLSTKIKATKKMMMMRMAVVMEMKTTRIKV